MSINATMRLDEPMRFDAPTSLDEPMRFDVLTENIGRCRARYGKEFFHPLLAMGWRLQDLAACDDQGVRVAALHEIARRDAQSENATLLALGALAFCSLILVYGFAGGLIKGCL